MALSVYRQQSARFLSNYTSNFILYNLTISICFQHCHRLLGHYFQHVLHEKITAPVNQRVPIVSFLLQQIAFVLITSSFRLLPKLPQLQLLQLLLKFQTLRWVFVLDFPLLDFPVPAFGHPLTDQFMDLLSHHIYYYYQNRPYYQTCLLLQVL